MKNVNFKERKKAVLIVSKRSAVIAQRCRLILTRVCFIRQVFRMSLCTSSIQTYICFLGGSSSEGSQGKVREIGKIP